MKTYLLLLLTVIASCSHRGAVHHYRLAGKVVALDPRDHTATVDAAAIPNFMEAMTMQYPVKSTADFEKLRVGENIDASVDVREDGGYDLSDIHVRSAGR